MPKPTHLPFTAEPSAQELLARSHAALLIGIVLYQQIPVEKAFSGPIELERRLGRELDLTVIAGWDPSELEAVFRERPALHRFPANMAKRTQAVCDYITTEHDGDPAGLWENAPTAAEVIDRMVSMPGFGEYKARVYFGVLSKWFGVRPQGWQAVVPDWPTIADVDTVEDLAELKIRKKAWKDSGSA